MGNGVASSIGDLAWVALVASDPMMPPNPNATMAFYEYLED